ncbi:MAG TPA: molybdenum cofactor guanylyltransferase [Candidatus Dormibacteraeota bacterium]
MEKATLLVLAGGASRRMGRPKASLPFGEGTLLEHVIRQLSPACSEVLVSGEGGLSDLHPGAGPLAGIEAGLLAARHDLVFAVACDMPLLTAETARMVLAAAAGHDAAVPRVKGRPEPAAAAYRRSAASAITAALEAGRYRAADVLRELDVAWLDGLDPALFTNANDPAAYRALLDALR